MLPPGELPLAMIERVLREGHGCGIDHLAFTGGEPTLHRQFPRSLRGYARRPTPIVWLAMASTFLRSRRSCCGLDHRSRG